MFYRVFLLCFGASLLIASQQSLSAVYRATLSKSSDNQYQTIDGVTLSTSNCYLNLYSSRVLIIVGEFFINDSLVTNNNQSCDITKMTQNSWSGERALSSLNRADIYTVSDVLGKGVVEINNQAYQLNSFCHSWSSGDDIVFFDQNGLRLLRLDSPLLLELPLPPRVCQGNAAC